MCILLSRVLVLYISFFLLDFGRSDSSFDPLERFDDDWRHVETVSKP